MDLTEIYQNFTADISQHWLQYSLIPIVASVIGYLTKVAAVKMMFAPMKFVGWPPYLGWQGVVPRRAHEMAETIWDTLSSKLLSISDLVAKLDPHEVVLELHKPLNDAAEEITREVAIQFFPGMWEALTPGMRARLVKNVQDDVPAAVERMLRDIILNVDEVFDAKEMLVTHLTRDKDLLNRIFLTAGSKEFDFIRRSGLYFGFAIGCIQVPIWALTHSMWVMPLFGLFIGWFSDWMALKMVFSPREPTRYLGIFTWQGLFIKRRHEVAKGYGEMIAGEVITARNIFESGLSGRMSEVLIATISKHAHRLIEQQMGMVKPLVVYMAGGRKIQQLKAEIADRLVKRMPSLLRHAEAYVDTALDVKGTLVGGLQNLSAEDFENVLRPVFRQDEWKLIATGAVLGFLVGELQVHLMLSLM